MLTHEAQYGAARGATPDRLRTAAWLQYLMDRREDAVATAAADPDARIAAVARAMLARLAGGPRDDAELDACLLAPWLTALGCGVERWLPDGPDACARVPNARELAQAERYFPGSRVVFESAHGVIDAGMFDDPGVGWAALGRISSGVDRAACWSGEKGEKGTLSSADIDASRPGELIDAVVTRILQPRDDVRHLDEMAALAEFSAALAIRPDVVPLSAYGGAHNGIALAIRRDRPDLATADGLLAALSVCRLDQLVGAGSFWAYYLLAGIVIAAPDVVRDIGGRFSGGIWWTWLESVLAWPARSNFGRREDAAFERLRDAMSFTSRHNPIVRTKRTKRTRPRAATPAPFGGRRTKTG
ncbi:hypothetical protein DID96_23095 [Burkholderia sp. Bp8963]|uniref:hypothetical protein n=1 Tax=Burkholderia sp. Bp8963 TaxID=2184547 RepID=UPI000F5A62FE|nr:hypothetical protein [Burkholderia sp. Bp8963]RQS66863.1 hypothetical protein DID96_23095 [Burkholderia sp. Bp8963]